jgi:hypothetical protein
MTTYKCKNGSLKDGSPTYQCPPSPSPSLPEHEICVDNSPIFCKLSLTPTQKRNLIIIGVVGFIVAAIISSLISRIPIIGIFGSLLINLIILGIVGIVIYIIYSNYKPKPKPSTPHPSP